MVLAVNNGINFGYKKAMAGVSGHVNAIFLLAVISAYGLSTLLLASKTSFLIIKYLGIIYLAYIGLAIWKNKGNWPLQPSTLEMPSALKLYRKSLLLGLSNPKALVFVCALFPQFIQTKQVLLPQFLILTSSSLLNAFILPQHTPTLAINLKKADAITK